MPEELPQQPLAELKLNSGNCLHLQNNRIGDNTLDCECMVHSTLQLLADKPGSHKDSEYLEIIAYTLSVNEFPADKSELVPNNQLGKIKIVFP